MRSLANALRKTRGVVRGKLGAFEADGNGRVPRTMHACIGETCRACGKQPAHQPPFRLIYLAPGWDGPSGGTKVIYQHVQAIADKEVFPCLVFHPDKPGSSYTWMKHHVRSLPVGHFDPRSDFLVFPEVWAALAARFCIPAGLKYAIFVQNGYLAHRTAGYIFSTVAEAYRHAAFVLSISHDTSEVIRLLFPFVDHEQMRRVRCSVSPLFAPSAKQPWITYMPRKLPGHAERLELYLSSSLPKRWRTIAIEDLTAEQVAATLAHSSIFLSFADLEGYGLPPLEAALCGNIVVGYTGQAGREYFRRPAFREVPTGDLRGFVSEVHSAIHDIESAMCASPPFLQQLTDLATIHSVENEAAQVRSFAMEAFASMQLQPARHSRSLPKKVGALDVRTAMRTGIPVSADLE